MKTISHRTPKIFKENGFERNADERIISFYAKNKNNLSIKITLHEPMTDNIVNAEVVELMGHMHGNSFVASGVIVLK